MAPFGIMGRDSAPKPAVNKRLIRVWDLPTRVSHWLLVALVLAAFITGQVGDPLIQWHGRIGISILGLLAFRLTWGFCGSTYARFRDFFPSPQRLLAYSRGQWRGVGHNPLGALAVFALLGILGLQGVTGLFAQDDIAFQGPLMPLVDTEVSRWLTRVHRLNFQFVLAVTIFHVTAILFYALVEEDNLVIPMLTGLKEVEVFEAQSASGGGFRSFLLALLLALGVVAVVSGVFIEQPPPPPAPAW